MTAVQPFPCPPLKTPQRPASGKSIDPIINTVIGTKGGGVSGQIPNAPFPIHSDPAGNSREPRA
jgi:hypothetical protein